MFLLLERTENWRAVEGGHNFTFVAAAQRVPIIFYLFVFSLPSFSLYGFKIFPNSKMSEMLHNDGFWRVLNNLTYGLEKKKDAKEKKKKNDAWAALYHNRSYPIKKDKVNPPLKLVIGKNELDANVLQDDRNLKISFTLIPGFTAFVSTSNKCLYCWNRKLKGGWRRSQFHFC